MEYRVSVEEATDVSRTFRAEIPITLYNEEYDREVRRTANQVELKGFRKGKVPLDVVKKMYGQRIRDNIIDELFRRSYEDAVSKNKLQVVGVSNIKIDDGHEHNHAEGEVCDHEPGKDLVFTADLALLPEPKIQGYEGVQYEVEVAKADDTMLERALKHVQESCARITPIEDRTSAQMGDFISVSYKVFVDGEQVQSRRGNEPFYESFVLGESNWPKELEAAVTGMTVSSEKEVSCNHPADFVNPRLAGKEARYELKLEKLSLKVLPEVSDELAKESGFAETVDAMKDTLREAIDKRIGVDNENRHTTQLMKELVNKNTFTVPQIMIDEEIRQMLFEIGVLDQSKRESFRINIEPFREKLGGEAEFRVRRSIILQQIAAQENLEANEADVEAWLDERADEEGQGRDRVNAQYGYPRQMERLKTIALFQKALKLVREKSAPTEKPLVEQPAA
jgi:trigger factor